MNVYQIKSKALEMELSFDCGIVLQRLRDEKTGFLYITEPEDVFLYGYNDGDLHTSRDLTVKELRAVEGNGGVRAEAWTLDGLLKFSFSAKPAGEGIEWSLSVANTAQQDDFIHLRFPVFRRLQMPGAGEDTLSCVPQELGNLDRFLAEGSQGLERFPDSGVPHGCNSVNAAAVYTRGKGGLCFVDIEGRVGGEVPPIQFQTENGTLDGAIFMELRAGETACTPKLSIGRIGPDEDWRKAVDLWAEAHPESVEGPNTPRWLRECGAIYANRPDGAGGGYLCFPEQGARLRDQVDDFRELPRLLEKAQRLGTDVLYLVDWYDPVNTEDVEPDQTEDPEMFRRICENEYWHKGDYVPLKVLGGVKALREGTEAVHALGGKLILYVEPFIIFHYSRIAREKGKEWTARELSHQPAADYIFNYAMNVECSAWQAYVERLCRKIVREYGADGIFLDSLGWQWNRRFLRTGTDEALPIREYNTAWLQLAERVRQGIRKEKPDAVVLCESCSGPLLSAIDGGLTCDMGWAKRNASGKLLGAPVRRVFTEANQFSNGTTMNELHQFFAAGINLALTYPWDDGGKCSDEICLLVHLRQQHADALVYGKLQSQPWTGSLEVPAYIFKGQEETVMNVCNTTAQSFAAGIELDDSLNAWIDLMSGERILTVHGRLVVNMAPLSLRILKSV